MENEPKRPTKGMHTDFSPVDQPENTARFVLGGVNETKEGEGNRISNEEGNEPCYELPSGYVPIGDVYIGDGNTLLFLVSGDGSLSEMGIADRECNYTTVVNSPDLGFSINHQISAIFRLRRGCERTVYWVDPKLRILNLDKLEDFKTNGNWDPDKFRLFKTYSEIPTFEEVEIVEGGNLLPGSYNISVQLLDNDLNPTEWMTTSQTLMIYNDNVTKAYEDIRGSTNLKTLYQDFGNTNKAIRMKFGNLDRSYPFYRVAIIEANAGTGEVTGVKVSQEIPTEIPTYTYTGTGSTTVTVEEIATFTNILETAKHIEQLENKLIVANVQGKQINYCKLQKYASGIKADLITKTTILNAITEGNPKTGTVYFDGAGYMPGEIYSFGIVWVFEGGLVSPAYHIPGKNHGTEGTSFTPSSKPMSINNQLSDTYYTDNNTCGTLDYWGVDSEGIPLLNQKVRHHRFPTRSEAGLSLLSEDDTGQADVEVNQLTLVISGSVSDSYEGDTLSYAVEYQIDGNTFLATRSLNVNTYNLDPGLTLVLASSTKPITVVNVYEDGVITGNPAPSGLTYTTSVGEGKITVGEKVFTSETFGIRFSGIEPPPLEATGGEKVIGYYIVRNERNLDNRTVMDSAVLSPILEEENFLGFGHLMPRLSDTSRIKTDTFAFIHPEYLFLSREFKTLNSIVKEGEFNRVGNPAISDLLIQDTMAGSSYDPEVHRRRERDSDGFDLHLVTRDNEIKYAKTVPISLAYGSEIEEVFYLNVLTGKLLTDSGGAKKEIYNVSGDNKVGIVKLNKDIPVENVYGKLPYVILKRELTDPYQNFRVDPYYKETNDPQIYLFDGSGNISFGTQTNVFNGDAVVTPMRFTNSVLYDIKIKNRKSKRGWFNFLVAAVSVVVGLVLALPTGGASLAVTSIGLAAVGFGITQAAVGIRKEQMSKVWGELYEAGLRNTIVDDDMEADFGGNPPDDEIQWFSDTLTNLWFESTVNMALRQGTTVGIPDFLNAPVKLSEINTTSTVDTPQNEVDTYLLNKLTNLDADNGDGMLYQGFANAELYEINLDYLRRNREKIFSHLGIEYDCCSDCMETFTHRYHYSEQSFDEELTDNFRVFLPNNYRDLEGSTGDITGLYRFYENLYIHTEEALWMQPKNYQERVTDEIVSFIGTGSYFEIPPRKMLDGEESSAGTRFKWGVTKTKNGILFPSEREGKIYLFDGEKLQPISDLGNSNWFRQNIPITLDREFYRANGREYPLSNNPSNPFGTGFISTYDTEKERLIITKRDHTLSSLLQGETDYQICSKGSDLTLFRGYQQTIDSYRDLGYEFLGMENCRMKFGRTTYQERQQTRYQQTTISNTTDIHIFFDTSGSFGAPALAQIDEAVEQWVDDFRANNPSWQGQLYKYNDITERWLNYATRISNETYGGNTSDKEILVISFCNEAASSYHDNNLDSTLSVTPTYTGDFNNFVDVVHPSYMSFIGIHYPIVFPSSLPPPYGTYSPLTKNFLLHSLAALKGASYSQAEVNALVQNPAFTPGEWTTLKGALTGVNPYPPGLEDKGWLIKYDRYNNAGTVITPQQFSQDIEILLEGSSEVQETIVTVEVPVTETIYVEGEPMAPNELLGHDSSWTFSFSLKDQFWVSMHHYLPNYYFYVSGKFYSWASPISYPWIGGNNHSWRHNVKGLYNNFYGKKFPYILEFVSVSDPVTTRIFDHIRLITEAKLYDPIAEEYMDVRNVTFNKLLVYNSRQISGVLDLLVKDDRDDPEDYMGQQVVNTVGSIVIDRNEGDWTINELRDMRVDHTVPMFRKDKASLATDYFMDKVVNPDCLDMDKHWSQMESFRDKYLVIRLIFDTFDNIQLITNFSRENENPSQR